MEKLKVFEAFKGYGSQSIAIDNLGIPHEVVATSEIDVDVIISYALIKGYDLNKKVDLTDDEIREYLVAKNIGFDIKRGVCTVKSMKKSKLHKLYNAVIMSNDFGDISLIDGDSIPDHDLFTMSSPCQDFSVAGKGEGGEWVCEGCGEKFTPLETKFKNICPECDSDEIKKTRSSMLFECAKIIEKKKPKYILFENVKNIIGSKHIFMFSRWCDWLEDLGYKNFYQVLNAKDYGIPQKRERLFMVSILDKDAMYCFPREINLRKTLKDILEVGVEENFYLESTYANGLLKTLDTDDYIDTPCIVASRGRNPLNPSDRTVGNYVEQVLEVDKNNLCNTLTSILKSNYVLEENKGYTGSDEDVCNKYRIRKLTPREYWRLMGMEDEYFNKCLDFGMSSSSLYKQGANSIVVDVLEHIFKELLKEYIEE